MDPSVDGRPPSPLEWEHTGSSATQLVWHHIIPFSLLRTVWNSLVDQHITTELPEARMAIYQYLLLLSRREAGARVDDLIDRMRAENTQQKRAGHHYLRPLDGAEAGELREAAIWPTWNIVEGPKNRSDDPADLYLDRFTAGLSPLEAARMATIESLSQQMRAFIVARPVPTSLRALAQAARYARLSVGGEEPIPFQTRMWEYDKDTELWHKARARKTSA